MTVVRWEPPPSRSARRTDREIGPRIERGHEGSIATTPEYPRDSRGAVPLGEDGSTELGETGPSEIGRPLRGEVLERALVGRDGRLLLASDFLLVPCEPQEEILVEEVPERQPLECRLERLAFRPLARLEESSPGLAPSASPAPWGHQSLTFQLPSGWRHAFPYACSSLPLMSAVC